jgi:hypothetical protein
MKQKMNINERFLRQIWQKKLFDHNELKTLDGSPLEIFDTGSPNNDGGPDFLKAKIKVGSEEYTGDIEIHQNISDWLLHSHSGNPKYNNIVLHVVLYNQASFIPTFTHSGRKIPVFILENYLNKPLSEVWEDAITEEREERNKNIPCFGKNDKIDLEKKYIWLERLGFRRLEARIKSLGDRLEAIIFNEEMNPRNKTAENGTLNRDTFLYDKKRDKKNWEQLLYEGILEGIGYSKNREPFIKLSQHLYLEILKKTIDLNSPDIILKLQAVLFGSAGLIPQINQVKDEETINYINSLNAYWNDFSSKFKGVRINKNEWQFFRLRPQNFPTVRLAGISFLIPNLLKDSMFKDLLQVIRKSDNRVEATIKKLIELFTVEADGYWCTHYNFNSEKRKETRILIGQNRIDDILINTLIPMVILYAREFKEYRLEKLAMSLYHFYPHISDNETSRDIIEQLLQNNPIKTAKQQQGAIHLYKFYCTMNKCIKCDIGKFLKGDKSSPENIIEEKKDVES